MFYTKFLFLAIVATLTTAEYKIQGKIVNGHDASRGEFPFYVFLEVQLPSMQTSCGGSLINKDWIVTAAHCLKDSFVALAHLGSLRALELDEPGRKIYEIYPENMFVHPDYSFLFIPVNDIGLIKLPESASFSDVIKPISYACSSPSDGIDVIAIGNGITSDDAQTVAPILQYAEMKTTTLLSCVKLFPSLLFRKSVICVQGEEQRSVCHGDSGGPLIAPKRSLIGLTSFGSEKGCQDNAPQIFTRIFSYSKWIQEVTGVECKNNS